MGSAQVIQGFIMQQHAPHVRAPCPGALPYPLCPWAALWRSALLCFAAQMAGRSAVRHPSAVKARSEYEGALCSPPLLIF